MSAEPDPQGDAPDLQSRLVRRSPVYYGWIVVLAGTLGAMMTTPGQTVGVSIFLDPIIAELGISRSLASTLYLFGTLLGSMFLPFAGRFIDRHGPRRAVIVFSAAFALACVWMGTVFEAVTLFLGFTLIRALGQGALSLVSLHVIAIWFVRQRGIAIGLLGIGTATATAVFPVAIEAMIDTAGWRSSYMLLGALVAATILPVGALAFRSHPERYGLVPDGGSGADGEQGDGPEVEVDYTLRGARGTLTFWLFVTGLAFGSTFGTGLVFHHYSVLAEGGIGRSDAALAFVYFGIVSAAANLATGALLRFVPPRFLLSVMLIGLAGSMLLAGSLPGSGAVPLYGGLLGLRTGMYGSLQGNVFAYYFGRRHFGAIKGFVSRMLVIGSAVGPLIFATGFDVFGSYTAVLAACAVPPMGLALVAPFLRLRRDGRVR